MGRALILPEGFEDYDFLLMMKKEPHPRNRMRLLAMRHIQLGKTLEAVSELVQVHWKTVQSWLRRFRELGFSGLFESKRSGAPRKLNSLQEKIISDKIRILSESKTGGHITGKELQEILSNEHNVNCSLKTVYNTLDRLGFSWITSRSMHPKSSQEAQDNYKKNL
jgi:transposase